MLRVYNILFYPMNGAGRLPSNAHTYRVEAFSLIEAIKLCGEVHRGADIYAGREATDARG